MKNLIVIVMLAMMLSGCGPTDDEIKLEATEYLENGQYRFLDDILYGIQDKDELYALLVGDAVRQIDIEIDKYLFIKEFDEALDFIETISSDLRFIDLEKYSNLAEEIELEKVEYEISGINFLNFDLAMESDSYEAIVLLSELNTELDYGVNLETLLKELNNTLGAEIYKFYYSASSISDLYYYEDQLDLFVNSISEEEQSMYLLDVLDLIWHSEDFDLADDFLEVIVKEHFNEYYDLLNDNNENIKASAAYYDPASLADYLENKSAIVKVYDEFGFSLGTGSSFFINDIGYLVTNEHVVAGATTVVIAMYNGEEFYADVLFTDVYRDFALLRANVVGNEFVELGNSYLVGTGDQIFTYGSPLGISNTLTDGVISNQVSIVNGQEFIQISAPISPGSSGGMLVDKTGRVIGITSQYLIGGQNMNLAIPINRVIEFIRDYDASVLLASNYPEFYVDITENTINKIESYFYEETDNSIFMGFLDEFGKKIYGMIDYTSGNYYEGEIHNGLYEGVGVVFYSNEVYIGEFKDGLYDGDGQQFFGSGDFYIGEFKVGYRHGEGSYFWGQDDDSYGHVYIGDHDMSSSTGFGMYLYPSGDIYQGDFVNSLFSGYGTYYSATGWQYTGEYVDDERTGEGVMYFASGAVYEGDFVDGKLDGDGTIYYTNGGYYAGEWVNGYYEGYGFYYYESGVTHEGYFSADEPTGLGTRTYTSGDYFTANWSSWCDGTGTYYWIDGTNQASILTNCEWE